MDGFDGLFSGKSAAPGSGNNSRPPTYGHGRLGDTSRYNTMDIFTNKPTTKWKNNERSPRLPNGSTRLIIPVLLTRVYQTAIEEMEYRDLEI